MKNRWLYDENKLLKDETLDCVICMNPNDLNKLIEFSIKTSEMPICSCISLSL